MLVLALCHSHKKNNTQHTLSLARVHPLIVAEGDAESEILFYSLIRLLTRLWPQVMQRVNQIRAAKRPKTG